MNDLQHLHDFLFSSSLQICILITYLVGTVMIPSKAFWTRVSRFEVETFPIKGFNGWTVFIELQENKFTYLRFYRWNFFASQECCETKRKYTYGEINRKSKTLAKALRKLMKLNDGDVVAVILTNIPEYPVADLGILRANLIITTFSPIFTSGKIDFLINQKYPFFCFRWNIQTTHRFRCQTSDNPTGYLRKSYRGY